ncbi:unnamed protein product [Urochloa humidicola]
MPKKHLAEEVWRLQVALGGQYEITKCTKQEYKRLQNEKVLCRICYKGDICMVLLPYRHRTLSVDQLIVFLNTFAKGSSYKGKKFNAICHFLTTKLGMHCLQNLSVIMPMQVPTLFGDFHTWS